MADIHTTTQLGTAPDALLLTPPQAAKRLAVSTRTLYSLFADGKLTRIKIGRSCRISAAELSEYVASLRQSGGAA